MRCISSYYVHHLPLVQRIVLSKANFLLVNNEAKIKFMIYLIELIFDVNIIIFDVNIILIDVYLIIFDVNIIIIILYVNLVCLVDETYN